MVEKKVAVLVFDTIDQPHFGGAVLRVTTVFASSFGCFGTAVRTSKQFKG